MAIPFGEERGLLEAARFMDTNECQHLISVARSASGKPAEQVLQEIDEGVTRFAEAARERFKRGAE